MKKDKKILNDEFVKTVTEITQLFNLAGNDSQDEQQAMTTMINKCKNLIEHHPSSAEPHFMLGLLAYKLGDEGQAIELCEIAHKLEPEIRDYAEALSVICASIGKLAEGLYYAKILPSLKPHKFLHSGLPSHLPDFATAVKAAEPSHHYAEASRYFNLADYPQALKECSAELRINQKNFHAYVLFAKTLMIVKSFSQAVSALHAAILIKPEAPLPKALLARALINIGDFSEAEVIASSVINSINNSEYEELDTEAYANAMDALLQCPNSSIEESKKLAETFTAKFQQNNSQEDSELDENSLTPINIGLISNAFFRNKQSIIFKSWLPSSPPTATNLLGYQQSVATDSITTMAIQACNQWREIYNTDPFTLDITMKADDLDILLDLSNTDCNPRLEIIGTNSSKYRVGSFCLPEPGFAPGITHVLCDDILITANDNTLLPNQKKLLVNGTLFARQPYFALAKDLPLAAKQNGYITFGGIIDLIKLSPDCALTWAEILHAVPNSKLLLCGAEQANHHIKSKVCEYFAHAGLIDRLMFPEAPPPDKDPSVELVEASIPNSHWREIDIFLDTFPFNCSHELCEALWTGAPVITLKSERRSGLFGASILTAAKRLNWVTSTRENYTKLAISLAKDIEELEKERDRLQENISNTTLFDSVGLSNELLNTLKSLSAKKH